ncbi:MAG: hypothetical protein IMZ43_02850, partial [Thermoplasmata archaeon]|nr:hypothetical protein [Thermoplasmata archaeon]
VHTSRAIPAISSLRANKIGKYRGDNASCRSQVRDGKSRSENTRIDGWALKKQS